MEQNDVLTVVITIITTLGGTSAWQYYQRKLELQREADEKQLEQQHAYRDDLRERVTALEAKLEQSRKDRDLVAEELRKVVAETAALRVEVVYLREEKDRLTALVDRLTTGNTNDK